MSFKKLKNFKNNNNNNLKTIFLKTFWFTSNYAKIYLKKKLKLFEIIT